MALKKGIKKNGVVKRVKKEARAVSEGSGEEIGAVVVVDEVGREEIYFVCQGCRKVLKQEGMFSKAMARTCPKCKGPMETRKGEPRL